MAGAFPLKVTSLAASEHFLNLCGGQSTEGPIAVVPEKALKLIYHPNFFFLSCHGPWLAGGQAESERRPRFLQLNKRTLLWVVMSLETRNGSHPSRPPHPTLPILCFHKMEREINRGEPASDFTFLCPKITGEKLGRWLSRQNACLVKPKELSLVPRIHVFKQTSKLNVEACMSL